MQCCRVPEAPLPHKPDEAPLPRKPVEAPLPQDTIEAPLPLNVEVALLQFGIENPNMDECVISNLELQKVKLQEAFEIARDEASIARSTKTDLNSQLVFAKMALLHKDDDATQREVWYV